MAYVHVDAGVPTRVSPLSWLRSRYPDTSFPLVLSEALLASYDIYPLATDRPAYDPETQVLEYQGIINVAGVWTDTWTARNKTQAEIDAKTDAEKSTAEAQLNANLSAMKAIAAGLQEHENRIRALEGNGNTVSFAQVVQWLKSKL